MGLLLDKLGSDEFRQVVALKLQGYTHEEISEMLQISVRTVHRRLIMVDKFGPNWPLQTVIASDADTSNCLERSSALRKWFIQQWHGFEFELMRSKAGK